MPDNIIVCQRPPSLTDLRRLAERSCIQVAEDLEGYFRGKRRQKVDAYQITDVRGYVRQLRETALRHDALEHEISVFWWRSRKERPDVCYALLVILGKGFKLLPDGEVSIGLGFTIKYKHTCCSWSIEGSSTCRLHFKSGLWR